MNGRAYVIPNVLILSVCSLVGACNGPEAPTKPVPVRVIVAGQPFMATVAGRSVSVDGGVEVEYEVGPHEVSGTFSGQLMIVAFGKGTAAGGVRIGSLQILEGPGNIPVGLSPYQDGCVAVWGGEGPRPQSFRVRFTVTTDAAAACIPDISGSWAANDGAATFLMNDRAVYRLIAERLKEE